MLQVPHDSSMDYTQTKPMQVNIDPACASAEQNVNQLTVFTFSLCALAMVFSFSIAQVSSAKIVEKYSTNFPSNRYGERAGGLTVK